MRFALKSALKISLLGAIVLAGCSASYPSRTANSAYQISSNGLAFASNEQSLSGIEDQEFTVTVARFVRDRSTNESTIVVTEEMVRLGEGFTSREATNMQLSLDGEVLTFVNGRATMEDGRTVWGYLNYALEHSATGGFYSYEKYVS
ncbi:MAG: hypothetical protein KJN60_06100, partial [Boseongicola sp.]|nr:hypothetical protein [Boseongicola sp.]